MFITGKAPTPKALEGKLWLGQCFFKQSIHGMDYIRFSPFVSLEEYSEGAEELRCRGCSKEC